MVSKAYQFFRFSRSIVYFLLGGIGILVGLGMIGLGVGLLCDGQDKPCAAMLSGRGIGFVVLGILFLKERKRLYFKDVENVFIGEHSECKAPPATGGIAPEEMSWKHLFHQIDNCAVIISLVIAVLAGVGFSLTVSGECGKCFIHFIVSSLAVLVALLPLGLSFSGMRKDVGEDIRALLFKFSLIIMMNLIIFSVMHRHTMYIISTVILLLLCALSLNRAIKAMSKK
jgi:hypothetical protein